MYNKDIVCEMINSHVPLICSKVNIRKFNNGDIRSFYRYTSDPEMHRYMVYKKPLDYRSAKLLLKSIIYEYNNNITRFAVVNKRDKLIGGISIYVSDDGLTAELGYWIGKPHWGKGYISDVLYNIIELLRGIEIIKNLKIKVDRANTRSIRVASKFGFIERGNLEGHVIEMMLRLR